MDPGCCPGPGVGAKRAQVGADVTRSLDEDRDTGTTVTRFGVPLWNDRSSGSRVDATPAACGFGAAMATAPDPQDAIEGAIARTMAMRKRARRSEITERCLMN